MTDRFGGTGKPGSTPRMLQVLDDDEVSPREYTFVPRDSDESERSTVWLTADATAVVDLEEYQ